jgi:hypothetical protein
MPWLSESSLVSAVNLTNPGVPGQLFNRLTRWERALTCRTVAL